MQLRGFAAGAAAGVALGFGIIVAMNAGGTADHDYAQEFIDAELAWADHNVTALSALQEGDLQTAQAMLEASLSLNVVTIDEALRVFGPDPRAHRMLARIADYRTRYPYESGHPEGDQSVREILQLAQRRTERHLPRRQPETPPALPR